MIERFKVAQLIMGQSDLLFNIVEQAAGGRGIGTPPARCVILCADLHTAVAAEAACILQGEGGGVNEGQPDQDVGSRALLAVMRGALQIGGGMSLLGDRKEPACVAHARAMALAKKAGAGGGGLAEGGKQATPAACSSSLVLLVPVGQEAAVATAAGAVGWVVDGEGSAQLLQSAQVLVQDGEGSGQLCEAVTPMLLHSGQ